MRIFVFTLLVLLSLSCSSSVYKNYNEKQLAHITNLNTLGQKIKDKKVSMGDKDNEEFLELLLTIPKDSKDHKQAPKLLQNIHEKLGSFELLEFRALITADDIKKIFEVCRPKTLSFSVLIPVAYDLEWHIETLVLKDINIPNGILTDFFSYFTEYKLKKLHLVNISFANRVDLLILNKTDQITSVHFEDCEVLFSDVIVIINALPKLRYFEFFMTESNSKWETSGYTTVDVNRNLETIYIQHNGLSAQMFVDLVHKFELLRSINIKSQDFGVDSKINLENTLTKLGFPMNKVERLTLSDCNLSSDGFDKITQLFPNLTYLAMAQESLDFIDHIDKLKSLEKLEVEALEFHDYFLLALLNKPPQLKEVAISDSLAKGLEEYMRRNCYKTNKIQTNLRIIPLSTDFVPLHSNKNSSSEKRIDSKFNDVENILKYVNCRTFR